MQLDEELDQIGNPHSDPSKWEIANSLNTEPIRHFSPGKLTGCQKLANTMDLSTTVPAQFDVRTRHNPEGTFVHTAIGARAEG